MICIKKIFILFYYSSTYPNGWVNENVYDAVNQVTLKYQKDPTNSNNKSLKFSYSYDAQGNVTSENKYSNSIGQMNESYNYSYDALNRLTSKLNTQNNIIEAQYSYDSLGNITKEVNGNNKGSEYWHNILNQITSKKIDNKDVYNYSYDFRGNLTGVDFQKNKNQRYAVESYVFDSTNRMTLGTNEKGETSAYTYNGLGHLIKNIWTVDKNAYGYTNITPQAVLATTSGTLTTDPVDTANLNLYNEKIVLSPSSSMNVITKNFVIDYTSPLKNVLTETETNGLTYRYAYGLDKLSVTISGITTGVGNLLQNGKVKLYYHHDRQRSTDYLTDNVTGKVTSYISYDEWGVPRKKAVLKMGVREIDLVTEYTGHPYGSGS